MTGFTHLDDSGDAHMVDVTEKTVTDRRARARAFVRVDSTVVEMLRGSGVPKGDALAVARIAAIAGTKRTPDLVPLCHPIAIHGVDVDVSVEDDGVRIDVTVRTADRTGVEMEALTGASVGALAVIDMVKGVDRSAMIDEVVLLEKSGGRSGHYVRDECFHCSVRAGRGVPCALCVGPQRCGGACVAEEHLACRLSHGDGGDGGVAVGACVALGRGRSNAGTPPEPWCP